MVEPENRPDGDAPAGTLTMLLTDVEGSTVLWEKHRAAMRTAIRRHHELAFAAVDRHDGYRPPDQGEGDSIFAVFTDPAAAVACALDLQRALAAEPWPDGVEIRVRAALHTGTLELRDGRNYAGVALSRCARLRALAHGGQTVVSAATRALVGSDLPPDVWVRDLGSHRLRDLSLPEQIFELCHQDLRGEFPPLRSLDDQPHNLPVQLTRFVGRDGDLAELATLLSTKRLVTLTGIGGCGKTRLALQLAAHSSGEFPDGAWLVELANVSDPDLVGRVVASALGVREQQGRPVDATLVDRLASQTALLVLDNCEHLIVACARLGERLLAACPELTILTTSREPLNVQGEVVWRVLPLTMPNERDLANVASSEAGELFVDRATAADPHFALSDGNAASVAAVCRRLEGIPLAIELAVARLGALTVEQIEERLADRFRLLNRGSRTAPTRHQTLRATVEWSHEMLTTAEQILFRRVAVFAGGFTLEAAEDVCAGDGIEADDVLDLLSQVVSKSLALPSSGDGPARYRLLETLREYGLERLKGAGEERALRSRHLAWSLRVAEQAEPELRGPEQAPWLDRLHAELDNFRAAFAWCLAEGDAEAALRLGSALLEFWIVRADWSEGREWVDGALALPGPVDPAVRMKGLRAAGELADVLSDYPSATRAFEESLALARSLGDRRATAEALMGLAHEAQRVGKHPEARAFLEEGVAIFRELDDDPSLARSLGGLAELERDYRRARELAEQTLEIRRRLGNRENVAWGLIDVGYCLQRTADLDAATVAYEEALDIARELAYKRLIARALVQLGSAALDRGDFADARGVLEESLPLWRETGHRSGLRDSLRCLGDVARHEGDLEGCESFLQESLAVCQDIGSRGGEALALQSLAVLALERGDLDGAARLASEAIAYWTEIEDLGEGAVAVRRLGEIAARAGAYERAARLLAASEGLGERVGGTIPPCDRPGYEQAVREIRSGLDAATFEAAWEAGGRLDLADAAAQAEGD